MPQAFYLPTEQWASHCILDGQEARHLTQALRMQAGEKVIILDGNGKKGQCEIEKVSKREVRLHLLQEEFIHRPLSLPIMALAWSKATRRGFFMEKAVELGVHEVWLWAGDHSQGRIPTNVKEHWQAQCIAGMKQCQNPWLPKIQILPNGIKELTEKSLDIEHKMLPWEVQDNIPMLTPELIGKSGRTIYAIGPEGGFSDKEIKSFNEAKFMPISLGNRVLRCETAALLCLGLHWWASHLSLQND